MKRGHHIVTKGDCVKLTKSGRAKVKSDIGVNVLSGDIFIIRKIRFAEGTRKYLVTLSIKGKNINLYLTDVRLAL